MARILLVEDEPAIQELIVCNLELAGHEAVRADSAEQALESIRDSLPDLVLLDWMLPGVSGIEICRRLKTRAETRDIPVIMLSARTEETDRVRGLETGADDYVVKPFSVKEVIARIRAVLRRVETEESPKYSDSRLDVDFADMRVACGGEAVKLTRKEFSLLEYLIKNTGRVASRQQLLDNVWGYSYFGDTRTLDVHIRRLRQKLGDCGGCIETVVGVGYRFIGCDD